MHGRPHKASDGTLSYPYRGFEPPPVPDGYRRSTIDLKSPDAWNFIPVLKPCEHRTLEIETGHCGAQCHKYFCKGERLHDLSTCNRCIL